jgi:2-aminobenzoate-CoA ligase
VTPISAGAESDALRWAALTADCLPPRALQPQRVYALADLRYDAALNVASELLKADPRQVAIRFRNRAQTYGALRESVLAVASRLIAVGIEPSDRVILRMTNRPELVAAWLAVQWIGAVGVHLPPMYRLRETTHIIEDAGATTIVCDADAAEETEALSARLTRRVNVLVADCNGGTTEAAPSRLRGRDAPAVICYITSADGPPKGVVLSSADVLASADTYARHVLQLTPSDVCIGTVSLAWAYGLGGLLTFPLRAGATIVLVDGAMNLLQAVADARATILFSVPTMYRMLLQHPGVSSCDLSSLRCCVSSAEPLPVPVASAWRDATGLEIVDGFGTTEMGHICISSRPGHVREGFIGTAVHGYEARIVDDAMRDVADGTPGFLAVRGPTGACYWRNAGEQRRVVRDGWTLTGDLCVRDPDGWFRHVRRADALVVSAGYKISTREVERALVEHPDVSSAYVFAEPDPVRGAVVKAVVARAGNADDTRLSERLQLYLKTALAPFKCPREIQIV